jgi:hypothetical protein
MYRLMVMIRYESFNINPNGYGMVKVNIVIIYGKVNVVDISKSSVVT